MDLKKLTDDEIREIVKNNVLTTRQVVELLGISRQQINNLMHQGKLKPTLNTANGNIFTKADVIYYLKFHKKEKAWLIELLENMQVREVENES